MGKVLPVGEHRAVERACAGWESAAGDPWVDVPVPCRSAIALGAPDAATRIAYLSVGSPIERVLGAGTQVLDRSGAALSVVDLANRLVNGEVSALVAPAASVDQARSALAVDTLPAAFRDRRQELRHANVQIRFLLRQIGLEEVASYRGAPAELYHAAANTWTPDLALCTDPAMLLSLGADRQRYVDSEYVERASDRLPRALVRLHGLGVRSYPRLVIV